MTTPESPDPKCPECGNPLSWHKGTHFVSWEKASAALAESEARAERYGKRLPDVEATNIELRAEVERLTERNSITQRALDAAYKSAAELANHYEQIITTERADIAAEREAIASDLEEWARVWMNDGAITVYAYHALNVKAANIRTGGFAPERSDV